MCSNDSYNLCKPLSIGRPYSSYNYHYFLLFSGYFCMFPIENTSVTRNIPKFGYGDHVLETCFNVSFCSYSSVIYGLIQCYLPCVLPGTGSMFIRLCFVDYEVLKSTPPVCPSVFSFSNDHSHFYHVSDTFPHTFEEFFNFYVNVILGC